MKTYTITEQQLSKLKDKKYDISESVDTIKGLCESEKPDIYYGFELGQIWNKLINANNSFEKLILLIQEQENK